MKKYTPPIAETICLQSEAALLDGSLDGSGGQNTGISTDVNGYNGLFQSERRGWNCEDWSSEES